MDRIEKVKKIIKENGVDAVLLNSPNNTFYVTGFKSSNSYLLVTKDSGNFYFTDMRYFSSAESFLHDTNIIPSILDLVAIDALMNKLGINSLGVESDYITLEKKKTLSTIFKTKLKPVDTSRLRAIKSQSEIDSIRESLQIAEKTLFDLQNSVEIGMTEKEISKLAVSFGLKNGADKASFDFIVASGLNGGSPHWHPSDYKIREGELITIDIGFIVNGYCSDITRTFKTSDKVDKDLENMYNIVLKANNAVNEQARVGMTGKEIDKIARDIIEKSKYKSYFGHGLGHSLGIEVHESPRLSSADNSVIQEGMIMSNEPGIYVPSLGGVRIEDILLFKEGRPEVLTTFPKELQSIVNS